MKAAVLESIENLLVKDIPKPELQKGSVILKIKVCSICSTDLRIYHYGHPRVKFPQILGHEISGEVEAVDGEVANYDAGDRVALTPRIACDECFYCKKGQHVYCQKSCTFGYELQGGYTEYLLIPPLGVQYGVLNIIADNINFKEASLAEPLSCCIRAQKALKVGHGNTVVVIGGGPVGIMHCRLAKANSADKIILVEKEIGRLEQVNLDSVNSIIDSSKRDLEVEINALTEGEGADVVIVACSSTQAQEQAFPLVGRGGRISFFSGLPTGQSNVSIDSNLIHYREISVHGSHGSTPSDNRIALDMLASEAVKVDDLISHTFSLDSIKDAFSFAESRVGMHIAICF